MSKAGQLVGDDSSWKRGGALYIIVCTNECYVGGLNIELTQIRKPFIMLAAVGG